MTNETRRILLVEDEKAIRDAVTAYLERENYWVTAVGDGQDALEEFQKHHFDLVILDLMLPRVPGERVCRVIRDTSDVPIIMLTAKGEVEDRIIGLELGADDYLVKPFAFEELMARIRCVARRPRHMTQDDQLALGDLTYYPGENTLTGPTGSCSLSRREGTLLEAFLRNSGQTLSRSLLLTRVWGMDSDVEEGNLDNYVHFLRRRLKSAGSAVSIKTVRGIGYRLEDK